MDYKKQITTSWIDRCFTIGKHTMSIEKILFFIILLLAIVTRFYHLGERALSHDESIHLYYSYLFSEGQGYTHTPLSHGPFQFHAIASLFFLFGSSDFIGRVPHAISSVLTILLLWNWRQYLGRSGTLIASLLMVISPFMLFYGRYARNESLVILLGLLTLFSVLRYLETKKSRYLALYTVATALHFTVKETAFIYTAQLLIFLFSLLLLYVGRTPWIREKYKKGFFILAGSSIILLLLSILFSASSKVITLEEHNTSIGIYLLFPGVAIAFAALGVLLSGFGWRNINNHPAFDILILTGTFMLPQLTAFPVSWMGWNPMDYRFTWPGWNLKEIFSQSPPKTGIIFIILYLISIAIGLSWGKKKWLLHGFIFWGIYIIFFTSFFTNPLGFFTGSIGSLGYWLEQQSVHRGNQPFYYYLLLQIPLYEYLPLLGVVLAIYFRIRNKDFSSPGNTYRKVVSKSKKSLLFFSLFIWWAFSSIIAFSMAGEKMPWLTVHISFPMILLAGWGLGQTIENIHFEQEPRPRRYINYIAIILFTVSLMDILASILGITPPFQAIPDEQWGLTSTPIYWVFVLIASVGIIIYLIISGTRWRTINGLLITSFFLLMGILTARTSVKAAFVNPGNAYEYLVYAHSTAGIKTSISTISQISRRVSGGYNDLSIAYDAGGETQGTSWPIKWYMRDFPNSSAFYSVDNKLLLADIIIADPQSYNDLDELLYQKYQQVDTLRIVWPNQDYFDLHKLDIFRAMDAPQGRNAFFQIWYSKDYSNYTNYYGRNNMSYLNWSPSDSMRIYVKNEILNRLWEYDIIP